MSQSIAAQWTALRRELHQCAELSNQEEQTAQKVSQVLAQYHPDELLTGLGGHGIACVFSAAAPGVTTMIRCELDALPVLSACINDYSSLNHNVNHQCGHDGHMTMVCALAQSLSERRPKRGRVVLVFQSAEETGQGAKQILAEPALAALKPDYVFALHNYPGLAQGKVALKAGTLNCASQGIVVHLVGKTSHAAHPEDGISPALALSDIMREFTQLPRRMPENCWLTLVHARLGEVTFGTAPGEAVLMATLRSETDTVMQRLSEQACRCVAAIASRHQLTYSIGWQDKFAASVNSEQGCAMVIQACEQLSIDYEWLEQPLRWSEDFGRFTEFAGQGAMFVLGSGEQHAQLHHPDYDFPDAILPYGISIFSALIDVNHR